MRNSFSAALATLFFAVASIGCYFLGADFDSSVGVSLLAGGLTGVLALCLNGVVAGSTVTELNVKNSKSQSRP